MRNRAGPFFEMFPLGFIILRLRVTVGITNVALVAGREAFVEIESLRSWATNYGLGMGSGRDTFYARLIFPWTARAEIGQSIFYGGG
jgi:hypothetical protein